MLVIDVVLYDFATFDDYVDSERLVAGMSIVRHWESESSGSVH